MSDCGAFDNINYLPSKEELDTLRQHYIVLVARVLLEFFDFMKPFANVVPAHITHRLVYTVSHCIICDKVSNLLMSLLMSGRIMPAVNH